LKLSLYSPAMEFDKMKRSIKTKMSKSPFLHLKDDKVNESTEALCDHSHSPDSASIASSVDFPHCNLQESSWTLLTLPDSSDVNQGKSSSSIDHSNNSSTQKSSSHHAPPLPLRCCSPSDGCSIPLPNKKKQTPSVSNDVSHEISSQIYWPNRDSDISSQFTTLTKSQIYDMDHGEKSERPWSTSSMRRPAAAPLAVQERTSLNSPHLTVVPDTWHKFDDVDTSRKHHEIHPKALSASASPMTTGHAFMEECRKQRTSPPQLPPRRKAHTPTGHSCQHPENARIYPIIVDGKQISHTHYWLIPAPKHRKPTSDESKGDTLQRRFSGDYCNVPPGFHDAHASTESNISDGSDHKKTSSTLTRNPHPLPILPDKPRSGDRNHKHHGLPSPNPIPTPPKASSTDVEAQHLQSMVSNSTLAEAKEALVTSHNHVPTAITLLQVEQLYKLRLSGVTREVCRHYLEQHNFNVERAAAALVDKYCTASNETTPTHMAQ
jgi:hypothetical protein